MFATKAVILRMEYASQEQAFLNAFCPITQSPTFVVIDKGHVLEKIEGPVSQEDFMTRISNALALEMYVMQKSDFENARKGSSSQAPTPATTTTANVTETSSATPESPDHVEEAQHTQPSDPISSTPPPPEASADMSQLFPDRAQQHEEEKARREAAEKAQRVARANARRKEAEAATNAAQSKGKGKAGDLTDQEKSRRDWISQQKIRNDGARKERERILAQIEADKQERKARSQRAPVEGPSESLLTPSAEASSRRRTGAGGICSLMIRLFDGSSIKGRFEPSATLAGTVRDWITAHTAEQGNVHAADIPFTFKQIMAPQPSRNIEISEEHQTLSDLGLVPSATLVLAPVAGYTEAYSSSGGRGYISSAFQYTCALAHGATSLVGSALSYIPTLGGPTASTPSGVLTGSRAPGLADSDPSGVVGMTESPHSAKPRVSTLADQRVEAVEKEKKKKRKGGEKTEFYNGNSSAFEGRKNEDEDDSEDHVQDDDADDDGDGSVHGHDD